MNTLEQLKNEYARYQAMGLKMDMSRGKPGPDTLVLSDDMMACVDATNYKAADGTDTRNYGVLEGIAECRALFGELLGVSADKVLVGGNSSLALQFDFVTMAMTHGLRGNSPWKAGKTKVLFPVPGYDRHFAIAAHYGLEAVTVPMNADGPDMDAVEKMVAEDDSISCLWCVPKYSNPTGITFSDDVVKRLAAMKTAAPDFTIIYDNAYCVHDLYPQGDVLRNIMVDCENAGNPERVVAVCSTSKISFPGAGVCAMTAGPETMAQFKKRLFFQTIGHDKINMLRHTRYYRDMAGITAHMQKLADVLRPKFDLVLSILEERLAGKGVAQWFAPRGGYFISVDVNPGCAKRTLQLMKEAGVVMTPAGATYPTLVAGGPGGDPEDRNIRIAPTFPGLEELKTCAELFCVCAEMVWMDK